MLDAARAYDEGAAHTSAPVELASPGPLGASPRSEREGAATQGCILLAMCRLLVQHRQRGGESW